MVNVGTIRVSENTQFDVSQVGKKFIILKEKYHFPFQTVVVPETNFS
jgi:hypothetical protein